MTTRRVCAVLAFIWTFGLLIAATSLWYNKLRRAVGTIGGAVALLVISVAFIKIYRRLRAQQVQPQAPDQVQQQARNTLNMARYRRTASAMLVVYVLFLFCYLPFWCLFNCSQISNRRDSPDWVLVGLQLLAGITQLFIEPVRLLLESAWNPHRSRETAAQTVLSIKLRSVNIR